MSNLTTEDRALVYLEKRAEGLTYREVGEAFGLSSEAVRSVIRRWRNKNGDPTPLPSSEPTEHPAHVGPKKTKVLVFDIETAPATAFVWRGRTDYVPMSNVIEDPRILCFAAKWLDGPMMFSSEWDHGREEMLSFMFDLLNEADAVVTYNGDNFDIKWLNSEFHEVGLGKPTPFKSIDLIKTIRKHMGSLMYKKLDYVAQKFLGDNKIDNGGIQLWRDLLLAENGEDGVASAKAMFKEYNKQDVALTEELYYNLLPWIDNHPPVYTNVFIDEAEHELWCRKCGSTDIVRNGWHLANMFKYPRYQCGGCGSHLRTISGGVRLTETYSV